MAPSASGQPDRLNVHLARLLAIGTWISCGLIMLGMTVQMAHPNGQAIGAKIVTFAIGLLIALPVARIGTMGIWFIMTRDRDFTLIAVAVLVIIIASTSLGMTGG